MNKPSNFDVITSLHEITLAATKNNLLIIKSAATKEWMPIKEFATKALVKAEKTLPQLLEFANYIQDTKCLVNFGNTLKILIPAIRANEQVILNAILFRLHAELELNNTMLKGYKVSGSSAKALESLKGIVDSAKQRIKRKQSELYIAVIDKPSKTEISKACLEKASFFKNLVSELAKVQSNYTLVCKQLKRKGVTKNVERLGYQLAMLNSLIRECIASVVSAHTMMFLANGIKMYQHVNGKSVFTNALNMPFDISLPNGKNIGIANVKDVDEDAFVELGGFVRNVETVELANEGMASVIKLEDISTYKSVNVVLPYVNIANYGFTRGAYCHVNGFVKHKSDKADYRTAIFGDKLNLKTDLSKSWRIAFLNLGSELYTAWPSSLNMYWSSKISTLNKSN